MAYCYKELLARNELCRIFCVGRLASTVTINTFGFAGGYHGIWIDQEHVGSSYKEIELATTAARANGMDSLVRVAPTGYSVVTQAFEAGAGGVMGAQITSAEHAEEFVQWSKFGPRGWRGMNTSGFDAQYTFLQQKEFAEKANREHFVAIQIETLGAVKDAEKIAAIDGVDLLFLGPADLSQALGVQGEKNHAKVWEVYDHVAAACKKHGKHWGTVPADPAFAVRCYDMGCRMLSLGADVFSMRLGVQALKGMHEKLFKV